MEGSEMKRALSFLPVVAFVLVAACMAPSVPKEQYFRLVATPATEKLGASRWSASSKRRRSAPMASPVSGRCSTPPMAAPSWSSATTPIGPSCRPR